MMGIPAKSWRVSLIWFLGVVLAVFLGQTLPFWHHHALLAGTHADGPFYFSCEEIRLYPQSFPGDLAVQSNRHLGAYEFFLGFVVAFARATGLGLLNANLVICWLGNGLYLAGVMVLLRSLGARPVWAAVGTLLAAQPFVLIGMSSGVTHSLAIPREACEWPVPWFTAWFVLGPRRKFHLVVFYGCLGAVFAISYPLWAVLLGVAFGLVDAAGCVREKNIPALLWLGAAALTCMIMVAIPSLTTYHAVASADGSVLDYNQISTSVYFSKGFRRLLAFAALGGMSLWLLRPPQGPLGDPWRRLSAVFLAALGVCLVYEPFQRLAQVISLLYPGRLSLLVYLVAMCALALALNARFMSFSALGRVLALGLISALCVFPSLNVFEEAGNKAKGPIPTQVDFVDFCGEVRQTTPLGCLLVVPPLPGTHYFRVYAERSLWISDKDTGVLSHSRRLYAEGTNRLSVLQEFYRPQTSPIRREALLKILRDAGVGYAVVDGEAPWVATLSCPVRLQKGKWQLRQVDPDSKDY